LEQIIWGRCYDHNFLRFSAKKLAFFSKTNVMIKVLHNLALFRVKNANFFAEFFGENILKNHNIGLWSPWLLFKCRDRFNLSVRRSGARLGGPTTAVRKRRKSRPLPGCNASKESPPKSAESFAAMAKKCGGGTKAGRLACAAAAARRTFRSMPRNTDTWSRRQLTDKTLKSVTHKLINILLI
jgi:hypothetical protein